MRRFYLISSLLFLSFTVFGQLRLNYNCPRPGDELVKQQVESPDPGESGDSLLWDFSHLKTVNENYAVSYSLPTEMGDSLYVMGSNAYPVQEFTSDSDLIIAKEFHTQYFYFLKGDTLEMLGHENPVVRYKYILPYVQTVFPLDYGGFSSYPYQATGIYSGTDSISTEGTVSSYADARGRVILPSCDTLSQVLRVKTYQSIINNLDTMSSKQRVLETCRWYTKGYRYPVFETVRSYNLVDSTVHFKTAFYYPPQDHYYLDNDPSNQAVLDSLWADGSQGNEATDSSTESTGLSIPGVLSCKMYPNPVETELTVDYEVTMAANISFGIYSIEGFPISTLPVKYYEPGSYSVSFNCSGLYARNYVLRVVANNKLANGVIIKK